MGVRRPSRPNLSAGTAGLSEAGTVKVPKINTDPIWSLRPWPLIISLRNRTIELPELCATDWLIYLLAKTPDLDGLILDWLPQLEDLVTDQVIDIEEMYNFCLEILATVAAHPWWVTLRLTTLAAHSWDLLGPKLMFHGVNPNTVSLAAWLDALLIIILENTDPKQVPMFTMQLEAPPLAAQQQQDSLEMDRNAFLSMMN